MKKIFLASMLMSMSIQLFCLERPTHMHSIVSLVRSALCKGLSAGEKVVESVGFGCTKIGDAGEYILDQVHKHHVASGIAGLTLLTLVAIKTECGKSAYGHIKDFFSSLFGARTYHRC